MDAREYLARKGLDGERDKERPNTLEEKAWSRARESGDHRPKSGTPHDWEDWERYHELLAEGAEALEQKIDHEAHRQAENPEHQVASDSASSGGVEHFTPSAPREAERPADAAADAAEAQAESWAARRAESSPASATTASQRPEPMAAMLMLAILMPPLAVGLDGAGSKRVLLALVLMLAGWVPGAIYAIWWLKRGN